jgi:hypothetical protein
MQQPPQGYGPPPPSQGYGPAQGPGYPPPKRGLSAPLIIAIIFGCLFSGCLALGLFGMKLEKDEQACNADPSCKAEKAAKAAKDEQEAKAKQAVKEEKSAAEAKAKAEKAEHEGTAKAQKADEQDAATASAASPSASVEPVKDAGAAALDLPGVGLTRAGWDRTHTRDPKFDMAYGPRIRAGVAKYLVVKDDRRDDGTQDTSLGLVFPEPTIVMYTMNILPAPLAEAEIHARAELPSDAKVFWSKTSKKCKTAQYVSASLARAYGANAIIEVGFSSEPREPAFEEVLDPRRIDSIVFVLRAKGPAYDC